MGPRGAGRQRHRRRLQRRAFLRGRRGALLLRRHVSDAEPDRRQSHHRPRRLRMTTPAPRSRAAAFLQRLVTNMASTIAALTPSLRAVPAASPRAALTLENLLYEKRGVIAYVTVNRPKVLNALNTPTWADLKTAFEDARDDAAVHGIILTGAGDKAFIAGADISELTHVAAFEAEQSSRFGQEV